MQGALAAGVLVTHSQDQCSAVADYRTGYFLADRNSSFCSVSLSNDICLCGCLDCTWNRYCIAAWAWFSSKTSQHDRPLSVKDCYTLQIPWASDINDLHHVLQLPWASDMLWASVINSYSQKTRTTLYTPLVSFCVAWKMMLQFWLLYTSIIVIMSAVRVGYFSLEAYTSLKIYDLFPAVSVLASIFQLLGKSNC